MVGTYSSSPISKVHGKNTTLLSVLKVQLGSSMNLARIKMVSLFILALCKVQTVNFDRLAIAFDADCEKASSLRRIQRFFAQYSFSADILAKIIFALIPKDGKVGLTMDRTNWKFNYILLNDHYCL